jgi:hypothetical protein
MFLHISDSNSRRERQICKVVHLAYIGPHRTRNVLLVWRGTAGRGKICFTCDDSLALPASAFITNIKMLEVTEL